MTGRPQSLLEREIHWAIRWTTRRWGLTVLLLFLGLWAAEMTLTVHGARVYGSNRLPYEIPIFLLMLARILLFTMLWFYLLMRRTLRPFAHGRLSDLLVTPLASRDLWPALIAGPVLVLFMLSLATELLYIFLPLGLGDPYYPLHAYLRAPQTMSADDLLWIRRIVWIDAPVTLVSDALFYAASCAMAAAIALPSGRAVRLAFAFFLTLLMVVPQVVLEIWSDQRAVLAGKVAGRDQLLSDFILGPLVTSLIALLVLTLAYAHLRSPRFWARLRAWSES
jgi:hypothetical protein